jgi:hypothetical protein
MRPKFNWNWTKGGMIGGLRMAYHNVHRVTDVCRHDRQICDLSYEVETKIAHLMNLVASTKAPRP